MRERFRRWWEIEVQGLSRRPGEPPPLDLETIALAVLAVFLAWCVFEIVRRWP